VSIAVSITETQIFTALRSFILSVLPAGVSCVRGLVNRVPEPIGPDFVVMTPIFRNRLSLNVASYADAVFLGSISGTTLTISSVQMGGLFVGSDLFGVDILPGTEIIGFGTGSGGPGTYTLNMAQDVAEQTISAGVQTILQPTKVNIQLDIHGPNSADNAQIITTLFRDQYAVDQFQTSGFDLVPLYSSEPKQIPFINGEQQYEERWTIDAIMQANSELKVPQQFASSLSISLMNVHI
jgi:hypothetical protein